LQSHKSLRIRYQTIVLQNAVNQQYLMASISRKLRSTVSIVSRTLLTANNTYIYTNYKLHINERSTHKSLTHSKNMRQQHKTPPRAPGPHSGCSFNVLPSTSSDGTLHEDLSSEFLEIRSSAANSPRQR